MVPLTETRTPDESPRGTDSLSEVLGAWVLRPGEGVGLIPGSNSLPAMSLQRWKAQFPCLLDEDPFECRRDKWENIDQSMKYLEHTELLFLLFFLLIIMIINQKVTLDSQASAALLP